MTENSAEWEAELSQPTNLNDSDTGELKTSHFSERKSVVEGVSVVVQGGFGVRRVSERKKGIEEGSHS